MSDLDNQGSLPAYVERGVGRSPRARDVPAEQAAEEAEHVAADEEARAHEREDEPATETPFEPSTGEPDDRGESR